MADAELTVRISGDTGDLESAISRVESQLSRLERSGGKGAESIAKAALNQGGFAKTVEQSKKALDEKRAVLAQTEKEYKKNSKAIQDNISGLEKQRGRLNNLAVSKQEEIDALKASSKNLDKNSTAYKDNRRAIEWTETELEAVKKQHRDVGKSIDEHRTALQNEKNSLEKSRNAVADAEKQYKTYASNLEEVEKIEKRLKLEEKAKGYRELGDGVDTLTKPFQVAGAAMAAGAVASSKFAIDFENNFADVRKTVDGTDEQLNKIKQDIIDMTTVGINGHSAIPQTAAELTELAAAGKATSGVIKGIGNTADAFAKIKKAKEAGGVLAKFAPALTAIKGAAPYAAAGIIAVTAAVKIGKAAYDSWYKSQYKWTDGMSEQQNKIRKSMNSYKQLSDIQAQLKNYRLIIENPESSQEQVDNAKQKIQEIVELLAKEYDLKINVDDNDELDNAVNNLAQRSKNELERDYNSQQRKLNSLENRYKADSAKLPDMRKQKQEADELRTKFDTLSLSAETLRRKWYNSEIGQKEFMDGMVELGTQLGVSEEDIRNLTVSIDELQTKAIGEKNVNDKLYKDLDGKITDLEGTVKHYEAISKEMANWASEGMALGVKEGDAEKVNLWFDRLSQNVKNAKLDMHGYAQIAAEAFNGIK